MPKFGKFELKDIIIEVGIGTKVPVKSGSRNDLSSTAKGQARTAKCFFWFRHLDLCE
jgi:hypothetical protein